MESWHEGAEGPKAPPTIQWRSPWREFNRFADEAYLLNELRWEIEANSGHPLRGKELWIAGWIEGYDELILYLPLEDRYAYVHLTWRKENDPAWPFSQWLEGPDAVTHFIERWIAEGR